MSTLKNRREFVKLLVAGGLGLYVASCDSSENRSQKNPSNSKKLPKSKGFSNILYPGERKNKTYKKNLNKDISIPAKILKEMEKLNAK